MENALLCSPQSLSLTDLVTILATQEPNVSPYDGNRERAMVTEVVHVPTSEHVAQIVGKAGSKIKALRAKTNTCIKTPLRGDQPVFTITGNPEDVRLARMAIEHASQHFTNLMTSRSNSCAPGEVTILVPVPQQYVGVVVGRGGTVIMKIKDQTNTRINTPKDGVNSTAFEVTGSPMNVLAAKEAIVEKVRQAFQLRNSSIFDPNLNRQRLINTNPNTKAIQMPQNCMNPYLQAQSPMQYQMPYNIPIGSQSTVIKNKSDNSKSLLVKSETLMTTNERREEDTSNVFYEQFLRSDHTGSQQSFWNI